jgi:hypothetical protein
LSQTNRQEAKGDRQEESSLLGDLFFSWPLGDEIWSTREPPAAAMTRSTLADDKTRNTHDAKRPTAEEIAKKKALCLAISSSLGLGPLAMKSGARASLRLPR